MRGKPVLGGGHGEDLAPVADAGAADVGDRPARDPLR
jgi:hypothetical protein